MRSIYKFIKDIENRPALYFGDDAHTATTLKILKAYLSGYYMREGEIYGLPSESWDFMLGFQDYVAEYYSDLRSYGWDMIISENCLPANNPLLVFFSLIDHYVTENPDMALAQPK